jgi:carbamate kinase
MSEIEKYSEEGYFAKGSMYPKVQACLMFLKAKTGKTAIISSLEKAKEAFLEKTGTCTGRYGQSGHYLMKLVRYQTIRW